MQPREILNQFGLIDLQNISQVTGGTDNTIYRVDTAERRYALRIMQPGRVETFQTELAAMKLAAAHGIPVPEIIAHTVWHDQPVMLLEWCIGRTLLAELEARPWQVWRLGLKFGQMQARINSISAEGLTGQKNYWWDLGHKGNPVLQARFQALCQPEQRLIHFDYHPLNVLTDGQEITAVLDWANAWGGDWRADWSRSRSILRLIRPKNFSQRLSRVLEWAWQRGYGQTPAEATSFMAWAGTLFLGDMSDKLLPQDLAWATQQVQGWQRQLN